MVVVVAVDDVLLLLLLLFPLLLLRYCRCCWRQRLMVSSARLVEVAKPVN